MFFRKKKKMFGNAIEPDCTYCVNAENGTCSPGHPAHPCVRFRYDPLLRKPGGMPLLKPHDPEEFKL